MGGKMLILFISILFLASNVFAYCGGGGCRSYYPSSCGGGSGGGCGSWGGCSNACQPPCSYYESPCACTDPGCCNNGCIDPDTCCAAFGNVGGM